MAADQAVGVVPLGGMPLRWSTRLHVGVDLGHVFPRIRRAMFLGAGLGCGGRAVP